LTDLSNLEQTYHYVDLMDKYQINDASFFNHKKFRTTLYFAVLGFIYLFTHPLIYEGWNFNSGNYLFTIDTK